MYTKAGTVREGDVVRLHGLKVVRCGQTQVSRGVWSAGGSMSVMTLAGDRVHVTVPAGVVDQGRLGIGVMR